MKTYHDNGEHIISIVPIEVCLDHRLTLRQVRVLVALFSFRNKDTGVARVKRSTLAERCGFPESRISAITTSLEKMGWIEKEGKGGFSKPSSYTVTVPDLSTVTKSVTDHDLETVTKPVTVTEPVTVTKPVSTTVTKLVTPTVTKLVTRIKGTEQSNEQSNEQSIENAQSPGALTVADMPELNPELASEFLSYRRGKKAPLTRIAWKGICREAESAGWTVDRAVTEIIERDWRGFKAEWVAQKQKAGYRPSPSEPAWMAGGI